MSFALLLHAFYTDKSLATIHTTWPFVGTTQQSTTASLTTVFTVTGQLEAPISNRQYRKEYRFNSLDWQQLLLALINNRRVGTDTALDRTTVGSEFSDRR